MPTMRSVLAALIAALLTFGAAGTVLLAPADAATKPKRIIEESAPKDLGRDIDTKKMKGVITEPQVDGTTVPYVGKVSVQKKTCKKCKYRTIKKFKTNKDGKYQYRADVPHAGRWYYRIKVKPGDAYAGTKGRWWGLFFR